MRSLLSSRLGREVLSCLQGFRNGFYYGGRLRLMHSLVMMLLFKQPSLGNLLNILRMAQEHAVYLGSFVMLFKVLNKLLDYMMGQPRLLHRLLAGLSSGLLLNRTKTPIKYQLALYLFSRLVTAALSVLYQRVAGRMVGGEIERRLFVLLAAVCWGAVMVLFEFSREHLQDSLVGSMVFLYEHSDRPVTHWSQLMPVTVPQWVLDCC